MFNFSPNHLAWQGQYQKMKISSCPSPQPLFSFTGEAAPPNPLGLKALSDFRGAKVPGPAGRLMAAC